MLICRGRLILGAPRAKSKLHLENTMKKSYKSVSMEPAYVMSAPWEILIPVALLVNPIELQHTHLQSSWQTNVGLQLVSIDWEMKIRQRWDNRIATKLTTWEAKAQSKLQEVDKSKSLWLNEVALLEPIETWILSSLKLKIADFKLQLRYWIKSLSRKLILMKLFKISERKTESVRTNMHNTAKSTLTYSMKSNHSRVRYPFWIARLALWTQRLILWMKTAERRTWRSIEEKPQELSSS